jgi:hypothetical protein
MIFILVRDGIGGTFFVKNVGVYLTESAKTRDIPFLLDKDTWVKKLEETTHCELTGIEFNRNFNKKSYRNPYKPSIDRIDSKGTYEDNNVRIVLGCVNNMLSDYGTDVFDQICRSRVAILDKK